MGLESSQASASLQDEVENNWQLQEVVMEATGNEQVPEAAFKPYQNCWPTNNNHII